MLFINDNQAELRHGCKKRRTGSQKNPGLPFSDPMPCQLPLTIRQPRMHHLHRLLKSLAKTPQQLRSKADLWHQNQYLTSGSGNGFNQREVYLGFPTPGHPVEQKG